MKRWYHWLMMWPCLWIGSCRWFYQDENWFSEQASIHWLKSRKYFQ